MEKLKMAFAGDQTRTNQTRDGQATNQTDRERVARGHSRNEAWDQYSNSPRPHAAAVGAEAPERIHAAVVLALLSTQSPGTVHSMRNPRLTRLS